MLDERKTAILQAVIREYIESAQPVGSAHISRVPGVSVSSATVRNEMAVLEQEGFLTQPHTSAGRVPTDKGYRYYVDHLGVPGRLDVARAEQVDTFFHASHGALERLLSDTSRLLATLTNYAAVVVRPATEASVTRSLQLVVLSSRIAMVVAVLANGTVESETVEVGVDITDEQIRQAGDQLARYGVGVPLASLSNVASTGDAIVDELVHAAAAALRGRRRSDDDQAFVGGASSVAQVFDAVEVVRNVLHALEHQQMVISLIRDVLDRGLSVAIGAEHGVEPLAACSVVVKPYIVDGEAIGTIGLLGPTRMNYPQALATVEAVSSQLSRTLTEGR